MVIIDPDRLGCTVWCNSMVQQIKGNPYECCTRIVNYLIEEGAIKKNEKTKVCYNYDGVRFLSDYTMYVDILLDTTHYGKPFQKFFVEHNIMYTAVKPKKFIK